MVIALLCDGDGPEYVQVTKQMRNTNGITISNSDDNPFLDSRVYKVEYLDNHKTFLSANFIVQVDEDGNHLILFDEIEDIRTDGTEIK
mmetsp:Transcript_9628/g.21381  ORF Transcript_9628/g.21381 Transcript_9628/m.21381 type:complete len:88 (-) Transcript_9628:228-491(-)|eukprot:CAMPEP_0113304908 /NCGR_PEP_ID=MMETSP0010_2-20120614/4734_1 /TAXON_ID=216773 ORGANISM="Corethron hystrix, Strain 308" /NCGR_SAMPLE_ID=MMETSP0010_2 /ASSEMBLY_ACC=CAM_ASM_000155 /LENGTH=87 /DNA_ID=CAMNT_0000159195 /DNA_START=985 /DNA_END=1248 /DNA_ORIENTATION=- /assembly_acc=CAM_ASM_000155